MTPIYVTKTWLPPLNTYVGRLEEIWREGRITNGGHQVGELERELGEYLGVPHVGFVHNGTVAIQLALRSLEIRGEVITTPYSYVATTSAILWEHSTPVFVDVDPRTFCLDPHLLEAAITPRTSAILATHVYGYPCDVDAIGDIARRHNLKVIYDAAHTFGVRYRGRALAAYGDAATLSFHATKLFHTVEGGAIVSATPEAHRRVQLMRSFGHINDDHICLGINAKNSEFHAAMGRCNLPFVAALIAARETVARRYDQALAGLGLGRPVCPPGCEYAYAYHPVIFADEAQMLRVKVGLEHGQIFSRRYFYPSLNTLPYVTPQACPVSESLASRVLCLPLYPELDLAVVDRIAAIIRENL
jgi:dTDP-4-amino-4,6-dideoxygalactose transaminase